MPTVLENPEREYRSGDIVEPGVYVDMDTGDVVQIQERDSLPETVRIVRSRRRFQRVEQHSAKN